jgi:FkbM family methyltransferase
MQTVLVSRSTLSRFWERIRAEGLFGLLSRVIRAWMVGRRVENRGNRVEVSGLIFSVENPLIHVRMKSTLVDGSYERPERALIEQFLPPEAPVVELGGAIGVVSCFTNRRLVRPEQHVVIEANPALIPTLEHNRELNRSRFRIKHAALGYDSDQVEFYTGASFLAGSVAPVSQHSVRVPAATLASILDEAGFTTACLIADIEGAEATLVEREPDVLRARIQWFIFEFHPPILGSDRTERLFEQLRLIGFIERGRDEWVAALENPGANGPAGW